MRSAEFLWQEGHTAHSSAENALETAEQMLEQYAQVAKDLLAIPVISGKKSANERFAGALETFTIEAMMQNGWALQAGTSHFLGQNFAKAFDVQFTNEKEEREHVWATSWGVSTRLLGALIMTHSDDNGLVLPPKVAPTQVVIIPITKAQGGDEVLLCFLRTEMEMYPPKSLKFPCQVIDYVEELAGRLRAAGIRVQVDDRPNMRPGAKYYHWERRGVPLRLEIGPRDLQKGAAFCAKRHDGSKAPLQIKNTEDGMSHPVKFNVIIHLG